MNNKYFLLTILLVYIVHLSFGQTPLLIDDGAVHTLEIVDNQPYHQYGSIQIPNNPAIRSIKFKLKGGDGGNAFLDYSTVFSPKDKVNVGGGMGAEFEVVYGVGSQPGMIPRGATLSWVTGEKGGEGRASTILGVGYEYGGGGGGTGLYVSSGGIMNLTRLLAVAGGGGGAYVGVFGYTVVKNAPGHAGIFALNGTNGSGGATGGLAGQSGYGGKGGGTLGFLRPLGGGGGGYLGDADTNCEDDKKAWGGWKPFGEPEYWPVGRGGAWNGCGELENHLPPRNGGWGFGGGGAAIGGGGGGGGYSGGGGGGFEGFGGGGGSYIDRDFNEGYSNFVVSNTGTPTHGYITYQVILNTPPVARCNFISVDLLPNGTATIDAEDLNLDSYDPDGDPITFSISKNSFDCSNRTIGWNANIVTLTVTDSKGFSSTCEAAVFVKDVTAPITKTKNITVQLDATGKVSITPLQVDNGSTDACGIVSYSIDKTDFDCSNIGTNTVYLTTQDASGNSSTISALVTVEDVTAPVIVNKTVSILLDATGHAQISALQLDAGSYDNCGIESIVIDQETFDCTNVGENFINLTITDYNGNKASKQVKIVVVNANPPNVYTKNVEIELNKQGQAFVSLDDIDNGSFDSCGITSMQLDRTNFDCANIGEYTVRLIVTNVAGFTVSKTAIVTVVGADMDNDSIADVCDDDMDGDGVLNDVDNCPTSSNSDQADLDRNGIGDVCDDGDLEIPKGFSPNGDGINDAFIIYGLHNYPNNSIEIYNRYGNKVYESSQYQNYWDGFSTGKSTLLPAAPYYYILSIDNGSKVVKGWIYINY